MKSITIVAAIFSVLLSTAAAVKPEDCIDEKFYRFTPEHSACVLPSPSASNSGVSEADKQLIVKKHNELRALQGATNMQRMVWDDEVASIAQRWTDNCQWAHDKYRSIPGRFSVGQNLAAGQSNWANAIQGWYDEIADFKYGTKTSFSDVGHYTQLVWAKSAKIGCGYTYCSSMRYKRFYACNYAVAGNSGDYSKPFVQGAKCADCPGKCKNNLCDCGGKVCENGGQLDLKTCECKCSKKGWHKPGVCSLDCDAVKESKSCSDTGFWAGKCFVYSNAPDQCPIYCNVCPKPGSSTSKSTTPRNSGPTRKTPTTVSPNAGGRKRLDIVARYNIKCSLIRSGSAELRLLAASANSRYPQIERMCDGDCKRSKQSGIKFSCRSDVTTISWPTDKYFPQSVNKVPDSLQKKAAARLASKSPLRIVLSSQTPPVIYPRAGKDGLSAELVLTPVS